MLISTDVKQGCFCLEICFGELKTVIIHIKFQSNLKKVLYQYNLTMIYLLIIYLLKSLIRFNQQQSIVNKNKSPELLHGKKGQQRLKKT